MATCFAPNLVVHINNFKQNLLLLRPFIWSTTGWVACWVWAHSWLKTSGLRPKFLVWFSTDVVDMKSLFCNSQHQSCFGILLRPFCWDRNSLWRPSSLLWFHVFCYTLFCGFGSTYNPGLPSNSMWFQVFQYYCKHRCKITVEVQKLRLMRHLADLVFWLLR